jgi:DNA-binding HxlR family transcriptional regulator
VLDPTTPEPCDDLVADVFDRACPSRRVFHDAMSKWGVLVLMALLEAPHRFNALRRRVDGVGERMLAQTLQGLERDGFVVRDVQATIPPRVEYSLTPLGREVAPLLRSLADVVERAVDDGAIASS